MSARRGQLPLSLGRSFGLGVTLILAGLAPARSASAQANSNPRSGTAGGPAEALAARSRQTDLVLSAPFDRLTLTDNSVVEVEPIRPRPLPPLEESRSGKSLVEIEAILQREKERRNGPEEMITVHLLDGETRDYQVRRASIKSVDYFEDLLIADADRLVAAGDFARAFERLLLVRVRDPNWRGLDPAVNRLLFAEGTATLTQDDGRGLRLLSELLARQPTFPGLVESLALAFARKVDRAATLGNFFEARQFLREMTRVAGGSPLTASSRARLIAQAQERADAAGRANDPAERADRLSEAARIWPELPGLEARYAEAFRAVPTVRVVVPDLADPVGPFPETPAAERVAPLMYLPVLASDTDEALRGEVPDQLLAAWSTANLGATWLVTLRPQFRWSDGSRSVSAVDLARALADRAAPESPGYSGRWADLLDRVTVLDEARLEVKLTRPTARPATWLVAPVGPAHAGTDGWVATVRGGRVPVGDGPFRWVGATPTSTTFAASSTVPAELAPKVRRIVELRAGASSVPIADRLARGEVDVVVRVPLADLADVAKVPEVHLGTYPTPSVHRLALDGRTPALSNRKLRRALAMAIDRADLLQHQILHHPPGGANQVLAGAFVRGSFVADPNTPPIEYQPVLAKGLVAAALKELGGSPIRLTLDYPATADARAVAPKLAEAFAVIGVAIDLRENPETALEAGLRSGRRFDLAYRTSRPTDPLRDAGPLLVPAYDAPGSSGGFASAASPRILQLLIDLDRAPEPQTARRLAAQIDRESRDELPVIPLWQVENHYAWRGHIRGIEATADHLYAAARTWEVDPWLARDP